MGLRSFFHKIKVGFARRRELSIPYTSESKRYGYRGEDDFVVAIQSRLPDCKIKKNIIIQSAEGNAEIDSLVLYKNKLFAIEVKRWKGQLVERTGDFIQYKHDRWTDEIHTKVHRSPFKQLRRAVYLLRKQIPDNAWVNTVVFFEGSDYIETESDNVWFDDIDKLVEYIVSEGKSSWGNKAASFFDKCVAADCLVRDNFWGGSSSLRCIISDDSFQFTTPTGILDRRNISSISISHHWSYDEINIRTKGGACHVIKSENASVFVIDNGQRCRYALCNLDYIYPGY